jgi:hypothetical protein
LLAEFAVVAAGHRRAGKWNSENGPPVRVLQAALSLPFPRNAGAAAGPFDASCCTASISGLLLAEPSRVVQRFRSRCAGWCGCLLDRLGDYAGRCSAGHVVDALEWGL